ncbi:hypothetical protein BN1708_009018, partial [Verticillium longisporum]
SHTPVISLSTLTSTSPCQVKAIAPQCDHDYPVPPDAHLPTHFEKRTRRYEQTAFHGRRRRPPPSTLDPLVPASLNFRSRSSRNFECRCWPATAQKVAEIDKSMVVSPVIVTALLCPEIRAGSSLEVSAKLGRVMGRIEFVTKSTS